MAPCIGSNGCRPAGRCELAAALPLCGARPVQACRRCCYCACSCSVLDVCAKAGKADLVQQLMEVSQQHGLHFYVLVGCHRGRSGPRCCLLLAWLHAALCCLSFVTFVAVPRALFETKQSRNPSPPSTLLTGASQEMAAAGLEADAVAHTILLMAHEKSGAWEAALECYAAMQRLGLQSNSFTFRQAAS